MGNFLRGQMDVMQEEDNKNKVDENAAGKAELEKIRSMKNLIPEVRERPKRK